MNDKPFCPQFLISFIYAHLKIDILIPDYFGHAAIYFLIPLVGRHLCFSKE